MYLVCFLGFNHVFGLKNAIFIRILISETIGTRLPMAMCIQYACVAFSVPIMHLACIYIYICVCVIHVAL